MPICRIYYGVAAEWQHPGGLPGALGPPTVKLRLLEVEPSARPLLRAGEPPLRAQAVEGVARDSEVVGCRASVEPAVAVRLSSRGGKTTSQAGSQALGQPVEVVLVQRVEEGGSQVTHAADLLHLIER